MKEKKRYTKAYRNMKKSYLAIFLLSMAFTLVIVKITASFIDHDIDVIINNGVAIIIGFLSYLLSFLLFHVRQDKKRYIEDIEQNTKILKQGLNELNLIASMVEFNVESKKSELEILTLYKDVQMSKNLLINHDLFDSISLVGIRSLFDSLSSTLLKISTKKEFIDESPNLLSTIDNIARMIEEVILFNDDEKEAFLKEKERLDNLFSEKKKSN